MVQRRVGCRKESESRTAGVVSTGLSSARARKRDATLARAGGCQQCNVEEAQQTDLQKDDQVAEWKNGWSCAEERATFKCRREVVRKG
jgi:hypothetical protein